MMAPSRAVDPSAPVTVQWTRRLRPFVSEGSAIQVKVAVDPLGVPLSEMVGIGTSPWLRPITSQTMLFAPLMLWSTMVTVAP